MRRRSVLLQTLCLQNHMLVQYPLGIAECHLMRVSKQVEQVTLQFRFYHTFNHRKANQLAFGSNMTHKWNSTEDDVKDSGFIMRWENTFVNRIVVSNYFMGEVKACINQGAAVPFKFYDELCKCLPLP
eukprot:m.74351 g.74351  ORF g.74351 m.74351 type:complete len:128 (-) comp11799_c0_seq2:1504-1887(-)